MIRFSESMGLSRLTLLAATALVLCSSTQGAHAGGGGHSGDHGGMERHESGARSEGVNLHESGGHNEGAKNRDIGGNSTNSKSREFPRDREHAGKEGRTFQREDWHKNADQRKPVVKDQGEDKAAGTTTSTPGRAGNNTIHPIVTNDGERLAVGVKDNGKGAGATATAAGGASKDTIRPIVTGGQAQSPGNPPAAGGKLPPSDPVGNTHPTVGANPPTVVTVSNGVTTTQIQNGLGGVSVYSDKPGTITITNGKESTTLTGGSVTLSGNVGVGGGQGVQVGSRNAEGKTVVAIKPPPPAPAAPTHVTGGPEGGFLGALGSSIKDGVKAVGNGIEDGAVAAGKGIADGLGIDPSFEAHPDPSRIVPPPATSTIQQQ